MPKLGGFPPHVIEQIIRSGSRTVCNTGLQEHQSKEHHYFVSKTSGLCH